MGYNSKNFYNDVVSGSMIDLYTTPSGKEAIVTNMQICNTDGNAGKELTMGVVDKDKSITVDSVFNIKNDLENNVGTYVSTRLAENKRDFIGDSLTGWSASYSSNRMIVSKNSLPTIRLHTNNGEELIAVRVIAQYLRDTASGQTMSVKLANSSSTTSVGSLIISYDFQNESNPQWIEFIMFVNPTNSGYQDKSQYLKFYGNTDGHGYVYEAYVYAYYRNKPSYESKVVDLNVVGDIDTFEQSITNNVTYQTTTSVNYVIIPVIKWTTSVDGKTWENWSKTNIKSLQSSRPTHRYAKFGVFWDTKSGSYGSTNYARRILGASKPKSFNDIPVTPSFTIKHINMFSKPTNKIGMLFNRLKVRAGETISIDSAINIPQGKKLIAFCGNSMLNTTNYGFNINVNGVEK